MGYWSLLRQVSVKDPYNKSVDENWNQFKEAMISSMKINIPQKKITSRWILPWLTPEIKRLYRGKKRAWDAGKHNRNSHSWKRFLKISKKVKKIFGRLSQNLYRQYPEH